MAHLQNEQYCHHCGTVFLITELCKNQVLEVCGLNADPKMAGFPPKLKCVRCPSCAKLIATAYAEIEDLEGNGFYYFTMRKKSKNL